MHSEHGRRGTWWRKLALLIKIRFLKEGRERIQFLHCPKFPTLIFFCNRTELYFHSSSLNHSFYCSFLDYKILRKIWCFVLSLILCLSQIIISFCVDQKKKSIKRNVDYSFHACSFFTRTFAIRVECRDNIFPEPTNIPWKMNSFFASHLPVHPVDAYPSTSLFIY